MDKISFEVPIIMRIDSMDNLNNIFIKLTLGQILLSLLIVLSFAFLSIANSLLVANAQPSADSQNLSDNPGNSTDAQIAVHQNNVYVVWSDATSGNGDIYFKRSIDNGTSFGTTENLVL